MSFDVERIKQEIEENISNLIDCFVSSVTTGRYVLDIPEAWENTLRRLATQLTPDWLDWLTATIAGFFIDAGERAFGSLIGCISPTLLNAVNAVLQRGRVSPVEIVEVVPAVCAKPASEVEMRVKIRNLLEEAVIDCNICYETEEVEQPKCIADRLPAGGERELVVRARVGVASGVYPVKVYVTDEAGGVLATATIAAIVPDMEWLCSDIVKETAEEIAKKIATQAVNLQQLLPLIVLSAVLRG